MIPRQLGMQGNAAMYRNADVWMQTFDCCCTRLIGGENCPKATDMSHSFAKWQAKQPKASGTSQSTCDGVTWSNSSEVARGYPDMHDLARLRTCGYMEQSMGSAWIHLSMAYACCGDARCGTSLPRGCKLSIDKVCRCAAS